MKSRWEFFYNAEGQQFRKNRRFRGELKPQQNESADLTPPDIAFEVTLVPDDKGTEAGPSHRGSLFVMLSGGPAETEQQAYMVALHVTGWLSFHEARIQVQTGFVSAERIPESDEETKAIGEDRYFVQLSVVEVEPAFYDQLEPTSRRLVSGKHADLMFQYNAASQIASPVERYLAYFKILEKRFARGKHGALLADLCASRELAELMTKELRNSRTGATIRHQESLELLRTCVRARHNCAHLRGKTGYRPMDPEAGELEPLTDIVRRLARRAVLES